MAQSHEWMGEKMLIVVVLVFLTIAAFQWDVDHKYNALALLELHSFQSRKVNIYFPCEKYILLLMDSKIRENVQCSMKHDRDKGM